MHQTSPKFFSAKLILFCMAGLGIGGFAMGMALEKYGSFPGCILCHIERWILLAGGSGAFLAWIWWPTFSARIMGIFTFLVWIAGSLTGFYHAGIQYRLFSVPHFCKVQEADSLSEFMLKPSISCDQRTLDIWSVPASLYLGIILAVCALLCWNILRNQSRLKN